MTKEELIQKIKTIRKGTFINIEYKSFPKPLAAHKDAVIEKITKGVYRLGITYANMKINENKVTGPLPFGEWQPNYENYIITHTNKNGDYKEWLRIYTSNHHHSHTTWMLNGQEVNKQWLLDNGYIGKSSAESKHNDLFIIEIKNLIKLGA